MFATQNGMIKVGPFDTKAELLQALEVYCDELLARREMTESEVQALLAQHK